MSDSSGFQDISVTEGRMSVPGLPGRFVQAASARLRLEADQLALLRAYETHGAGLAARARVTGQADIVNGALVHPALEEGERFARLTISPLDAGETGRALVSIGVDPAAAPGERFTIDVLVPPALYAALEADALAGLAGRLALTAATSLWRRDDAEPGEEAWLLAPSSVGGAAAASARGLVETLEWHAAPVAASVAGPAIAEARVAAEPGADDDEHDPVADELARLNWSVKLLLVVLTFLMIVIAAK